MAGRPGRKPKKSLEEQIIEITNDISSYKNAIITLENKKEELLKQKRERDLSILYELIENKKLTIEDVQLLIESYEEQEGQEEQEVLEELPDVI